jgi:hypothetical protein
MATVSERFGADFWVLGIFLGYSLREDRVLGKRVCSRIEATFCNLLWLNGESMGVGGSSKQAGNFAQASCVQPIEMLARTPGIAPFARI